MYVFVVRRRITACDYGVDRIGGRHERLQAEFCRRRGQGVPVHARQDVAEKERVVVDLGALEGGVLEVQWEAGGGGLAGFDGAG